MFFYKILCIDCSRTDVKPDPALVIRDLWVYSRYGIWRFFRIEGAGIVEICQDGTQLKNPFQVVERTVRAVYPRKTGSALVKG
jgi:hypothetical protein